jgi:hypothetical protein
VPRVSHGRVTVGIRDDGTPDRRHVERKTRAEVTAAVRELEKQRDAKTVRKPGKAWTVKTWLTHWVENVAPLAVNDNTMVGYRGAVRKHLIPGLGGSPSRPAQARAHRGVLREHAGQRQQAEHRPPGASHFPNRP